jgi:hypothetical protein
MKYTLRIIQDQDAQNPASDNHSDVQLLICHREYAFGTHNFRSIEDCEDHLASMKKGKRIYAVPVYAYIHSGIALSLTPFSCPWDSGRIGWVTVEMSEELEPSGNVERVAQSHIDEMNAYLSGDVWWYAIEDEDGDYIDSCGGYYGDPDESGCREEGEAALARLTNQTTVV